MQHATVGFQGCNLLTHYEILDNLTHSSIEIFWSPADKVWENGIQTPVVLLFLTKVHFSSVSLKTFSEY